MVISIFKLPEEGKTWAEQKTGDICDCIFLEYEKFFNGVGTFTAELPVSTRFRDKLEVNSVLMLDSGDAIIVKNIKTTLDKITLTGYDLNGLLCDRLTLTDKEDGCDTQAGASETIIKHFVSANLVNCELDPNRNLPRFGIAEDKGRGLPSDNAMPRLQNVQELVTEICGAAKLGWRISVDGSAGNDKPIFVFDVAEQVDRSVNQSERNRVIFSAQMHNVSTMTREVGVTAAKNALFLDIDGTVVQYPKAADEGVEVKRAVAVGYDRREEYCSLTTDSLEEADYTAEAEQNMSDRMNETDSLIIDAGNPLDYGRLYDVGTIVTAYDRNRNVQLDSVISAAAIRRSGSEYSVKLTLGESKPKLLDGYQKKSEATQKTVRNEGGKNVSAAGVLTEYEYLTDLSVKYNGVTYTAEKDEVTGLISRISDSSGNEFEPKINSGITDVSLHNAVFWAVAMHSGLGATLTFDKTGIVGLFLPETRNISNSRWDNAINGGNAIMLTGGSANDNAVHFEVGEYGSFTVDEPNTVYVIAKMKHKPATMLPSESAVWYPVIAKHLSYDRINYGFDLFSEYTGDEISYLAFSALANDILTKTNSDEYHVCCYTRTDNKAYFYVDAKCVGSASGVYRGYYGGDMLINMSNRAGRIPDNNNVTKADIIMCAFGAAYHSPGIVANNMKYLAKKYLGVSE